MKRIVGIYFGPEKVNFVESMGRKVLKTVTIGYAQENINLESPDVDEQIRAVAFIQKILRDNKIEAKEAIVGITLKNLIIRFFELPIMPKKEFINALIFEVKRYLPFKIEELVFDFQAKINKEKKRAEVLFVATKKENIDKYIGILKEAGLKVTAIEPAILSVLRLLSTQKVIDLKSTSAVVELDEEKGLTIIDKGSACFAHELKISLEAKDAELDTEAVLLLKIANEIRLTLDYYRRQSVGRQIDNLFVISDKDLPSGIVELDKELDVNIKTLKIQDIAGSIYISDLGLATAFGLSQKDQVPSYFKINLLTPRPILAGVEKKASIVRPISQSQIVSYIFIGILIVLGAYFIKIPEQKRLQKTLELAISNQPKLNAKLNAMSASELKGAELQYNNIISRLSDLYKERVYLTPRLDRLVRIMPQGLWLNNVSIDAASINIRGSAYLADDSKEIDLINEFVATLKKETKFLAGLKNVNFSTERSTSGKFKIRNFNIECK